MAPKLSQTQVCGLFNFLGRYQKVSVLESWRSARVRAEEIKVNWNSFKQMRREKVLPKCIGNMRPTGDTDISPWTIKEEEALLDLIKSTKEAKERAFARSNEALFKLVRI